MNIDRLSGLVLFCLGLLVIAAAWKFYVPYQYEPLGPKAMPMVVGTLLALCGLRLLVVKQVVSGEGEYSWHGLVSSRPLVLCVLLFGYAFCYEELGFVLSSLLVCVGLARLCGASIGWSLVVGFGFTLVGQLLLVAGLGLQLPSGLARNWL